MNKILHTVRVPMEVIKNNGSWQKRIDYARSLNNKFYNQLGTKLENKSYISIDEYQNTLKTILPSNIDFKVKPMSRNYSSLSGYVSVIQDRGKKAKSYEIGIASFRKFSFGKNKNSLYIGKSDFDVMLHENSHLFNLATNPKYIARELLIKNRDFEFYDEYLYKKIIFPKNLFNWQKKLMQQLKNHLELMNDSYKINFLQYCRYSLLDEKIAYEEGSKYFIHATNSKNYFFDEKIKMIENLIKETINNVRKNQK